MTHLDPTLTEEQSPAEDTMQADNAALSPREEITRRAILVGQSIALNSLLFVALGIYLVIESGTWHGYFFAFVSSLSVVGSVVGTRIIKQERSSNTGEWILLIANLIAPTLATLLTVVNIGYVAGMFMIISGYFIVRYTIPEKKWDKAIIFTIASILVTITAEMMKLPWRIESSLITTLGPIFISILGIILLVIISGQAWNSNLRLKIITAFTIVALVSLSILGSVTYFNFKNQLREDTRQRLLNMVSLAALQQDSDLHASIQNAGDEELDAYKQIKATNAAILATEPEIEYLYTIRMNEESQIYFVVDTGKPGDEETAAVAEIYDEATAEMISAFTEEHAVVEDDFYTDQWGTFLSAYSPFYAKDGRMEGVIGIDIEASTVLAQERSVLSLILGTAAGTMVLVTLIGLWLGNIFTKPILNLSSVAQKFAEGDLNARAEIKTTDEIGDLAGVFNTMTSELQETLVGLEESIADRTKDLATVADISTVTATIRDPQEMLTNVVKLTQRGFNLYHAHVFTYNKESEELAIVACGYKEGDEHEGTHGTTTIPMGQEQSLVALAARTRQPVIVNDVRNEPGWLPNPLLPDTRAELAVPMIVGDELLGVLDVQAEELDAFTEEDANIQMTLASQISTALQNAFTYDEAQKRAEVETLANVIGQRIQRTTSIEETLQTAIRELGTAIGASRVKASIKPAPADDAALEETILPEEIFETEIEIENDKTLSVEENTLGVAK